MSIYELGRNSAYKDLYRVVDFQLASAGYVCSDRDP